MLKEWLTVPLELSTVTIISSANSCLAFCGETTSNFPPVTAKVVKSVNLFIESWVEFCQLELVLKRSINYMQYSTKNGIFTTSWNFYNDSFFSKPIYSCTGQTGKSKSNDRNIHVKLFYAYMEREQIILKLRIRMAEQRRRQNLVWKRNKIVEYLKRNSTKL